MLELTEKLKSDLSVICVFEEYGHLDLTDIWQYWTPPPPISPLNLAYTVYKVKLTP
jgi:hypothetical protein